MAIKQFAQKLKSKSKPWSVYMLLCKDYTIYTGITNDLKKRLLAHQHGTASKYTRSRGAIKFIYIIKAKNKSEALKKERLIKNLKRSQKFNLAGFKP